MHRSRGRQGREGRDKVVFEAEGVSLRAERVEKGLAYEGPEREPEEGPDMALLDYGGDESR